MVENRAAGHTFHNTSRLDFETLVADAPNIAPNMKSHLAGFSENGRESSTASGATRKHSACAAGGVVDSADDVLLGENVLVAGDWFEVAQGSVGG